MEAKEILTPTYALCKSDLTHRVIAGPPRPADPQRNEAMDMCDHQPPCPTARDEHRADACRRSIHADQGWALLCNGVILFEDGGVLLPTGEALAPPVRRLAASAA